MSLGQNPLPNSVQAKSQIVHDQSGSSILVNFMSGIGTPRGVLLAVCLLFLISQMVNLKLEKSQRLLCAAVSFSIILHLLFGQFGWFCRYEIYIWAVAIALIGFLFKSSLYRRVSNYSVLAKAFFLFSTLCLLCFPYLMVLVDIPVAANNIYEQQYQMHRFATEFYKKPVAANDIGYLSYHNHEYILDLWGLASNEALSLRFFANRENWIEDLTKSKEIGLAMIYEEVFAEFAKIPPSWLKVGTLHLGKRNITTSQDKVSFYATGKESYSEIVKLLGKFILTLPEGVKFVLVDNVPQ